MRFFKLIRQRNGLTLAELLISIALFGILMVAFLSLFASAFSMTHHAGDRDRTVAGISGKVENKIATSAYTDGEIEQIRIESTAPNSVKLTFGDNSFETVSVDKIKGTATDGTGVIIEYIKPVP